MSTFTKVKEWTFSPFFLSPKRIYTLMDTTEQQVRNWTEKRSGYGSGNWQTNSLTCKEVKVKTSKLVLTDAS
jgi:hypothetical protein